jgi:hypothetical protein
VTGTGFTVAASHFAYFNEDTASKAAVTCTTTTSCTFVVPSLPFLRSPFYLVRINFFGIGNANFNLNAAASPAPVLIST